jgi:electron-transferring-flavoprotein dehydrogenase
VSDMNKADVLFVGAGPANLAAAIKLKQLLKARNLEASVIMIEKAEKAGHHSLSGAVFEAEVLDELIPEWKESKEPFIAKMLANKVEKDDTIFLFGNGKSMKFSESIIPAAMHHKGNYAISLSEMTNWLAGIARGLGVEIYNGFAAKDVVFENDIVKGIKLGDKGLDKESKPDCNYNAGEVIEAKVTVFGEGSLGQLAEKVVAKFGLAKGKNVQIQSLGVKEIIKLPEKNNFGANRVIHTMGFPNRPEIFGGGTLYSMDANTVAVAVVMALDWKYCDLNPQQELQVFKSHPFVAKLIEGGEVAAYGAKTLPEGGYYSVPGLAVNGALIVGDSAGFTSARKLKGLHYAVKSGMLAAEAIADAVQAKSFTAANLKKYEDLVEKSFIMKDLLDARNYRQVFNTPFGIYLGLPLSFIQGIFGRIRTKHDYEGMRRTKLNRTYKNGIDRLTDVSLSGTIHREDEPSHITFKDPKKCDPCAEKFGCNPCWYFCPGEVYKFENNELILSPSNCLHCQTCRVKCPQQNIIWEVPEGGDGPKYKAM